MISVRNKLPKFERFIELKFVVSLKSWINTSKKIVPVRVKKPMESTSLQISPYT